MLLYLVAIAATEAITALVDPFAGAIIAAALIFLLLAHYALLAEPPSAKYGNPDDVFWSSDILPILALVPLTRLLSLTIPVGTWPEAYRDALIGFPVLLATGATIRILDLRWLKAALFSRTDWLWQCLVAATGVPLGVLAFLAFQPKPSITRFDWGHVVVGALLALVLTGFIEEIIFRGLLQRVLNQLFGVAGLWWSSVLFGALYLGSQSPSYILFITLLGLFFGLLVQRTGVIWGPMLAHGFLAAGMFVVWPALLR